MVSYIIVGQVSKFISFKQATGQPLDVVDALISVCAASAVVGLVVIAKLDIQIDYMKNRIHWKRKQNETCR